MNSGWLAGALVVLLALLIALVIFDCLKDGVQRRDEEEDEVQEC